MSQAIFIHRSVGHNLLADGQVYNLLATQNPQLKLSDYDQNTDTLSDSKGIQQKPDFSFPGGNTRPEDYAQIFSEQVKPAYKPILDMAMGYDTVLIKSCYPNSHITSDAELKRVKGYYQAIVDFFAARPNKRLIILTSPPLRPSRTNASAAARARRLANWLSDTSFAPNVAVFDLFDLLSTPQNHKQANMLRHEYRRWLPVDSHPNPQASREIAAVFVDFLVEQST